MPPSPAFARIADWSNLLAAFDEAALAKRARASTATFEFQLADRLIDLQHDLHTRRYQPGAYRHFQILEPKLRKISAAPFRDRVLHHALCRVVAERWERRFIDDSYACRVGRGTHRAVDRLQHFARRYRYALRLDIVKHFPSIDHAILKDILWRILPEDDVRWLVATVIDSGAGVLDDQYTMVHFPGDDLLAACRPRGLPIGNLTSQFWSNCYLDPLDHFIKRELGCRGYLRYVDDMALFSDSKRELYAWKRHILERLAGLRLTVHENAAQVMPVTAGIPWLGFVVYPDHRRVKARNVRQFTRRFRTRWRAFCAGEISFAEFDASVQAWINHVRYADSWGLRRHVLGRALVRPADGAPVS